MPPGRTTTFDAARTVARGQRERLTDWGLSLGLFGYTEQETSNGDVIPKTALQYIENHDHERFICNFGLTNSDEARNPLFLEGDRSRWFMLQPYLIAIAMSKGIPMLWQGEEFGGKLLPAGFRCGTCRTVALATLGPVLRRTRTGDRRAGSKTASHPTQPRPYPQRDALLLQRLGQVPSRGVLMFARYAGASYSLVALNMGDAEQTVPFWFPIAGDYVEELHGGALDLQELSRYGNEPDDPLSLRPNLDPPIVANRSCPSIHSFTHVQRSHSMAP